MALTIDLGLNRAQSHGQWQLRVVIDTTSLLHGKGVTQGLRTADERRALLGCYYLFAKLSYSFKRLDPIRYTQHLEDCCQALLAEAEYPSDIVLVQHVRLQRVLERYLPNAVGQPELSVPVRSFVRCFEEDIQKFKQSVPRDLLESCMQRKSLLICIENVLIDLSSSTITYSRCSNRTLRMRTDDRM
jgi:hypothetical protein